MLDKNSKHNIMSQVSGLRSQVSGLRSQVSGLRSWLKNNVNYSDENTISYRCRIRRMQFFENCFYKTFKEKIENHIVIKILDIGGTWKFWDFINFKYFDNVSITLLNLTKSKVPEKCSNVTSVAGDARDLSEYRDGEFDVAFSNSVIEHVGKENDQEKMAKEMQRVAKHCYLQTPNKYFPLEQHFLLPFFQFLPLNIRGYLLSESSISYFKDADTREKLKKFADSIDLLTIKRLKKLFPKAEIQKEKFLFMTKSFYFYI